MIVHFKFEWLKKKKLNKFEKSGNTVYNSVILAISLFTLLSNFVYKVLNYNAIPDLIRICFVR